MKRALKNLAFLLIPVALGMLADFDLLHWPRALQMEKKLILLPRKSVVIDLASDRSHFTTWQLADQKSEAVQVDSLETGIDPDRLFQENPPSAPDWLVILNRAQKLGYEQVTISSPLTWENADPLELGALEHALEQFPKAVLAIDLRREVSDAPLPPYLQRSAIPLSALRGSAELLPIVNRVPFPPSATGYGVTFYGFRSIETSPPEKSKNSIAIPLLARWGDQLLPSLELAHLMASGNCRPEEMEIIPGSHIRISARGPLIPIDKFCRLVISQDGKKLEIASVSTLLDRDLGKKVADGQKLLISDFDGPSHLSEVADELSFFAAQTLENPRSFTRLNHWQSGLIFLAISGLFFLIKPSKKRYLLTLPFLFLPAAILFSGYWLLFTPLALCLVTLVALTSVKMKAKLNVKERSDQPDSTDLTKPKTLAEKEERAKTEEPAKTISSPEKGKQDSLDQADLNKEPAKAEDPPKKVAGKTKKITIAKKVTSAANKIVKKQPKSRKKMRKR